MPATTTFKPASDKQIALIHKLSGEKETPVAGKDSLEALMIARWEDALGGKDLAMAEASQVIDWMFSLPRKPAIVAAAAALTAGIYCAPNGDVIKVKAARQTGNLYAQVMVSASGGARINLHDEIVPKFDFVYTPGLIRHITPAMKLTLEDAKSFYTKTGRCLNCKKELKVAKSIAAGLGPTCAKMFA